MKWPWVRRQHVEALKTQLQWRQEELEWEREIKESYRRSLNNIRDITLDQCPPTYKWRKGDMHWLNPHDFAIFTETLLPLQRVPDTELAKRGFRNLMWRHCQIICDDV